MEGSCFLRIEPRVSHTFDSENTIIKARAKGAGSRRALRKMKEPRFLESVLALEHDVVPFVSGRGLRRET